MKKLIQRIKNAEARVKNFHDSLAAFHDKILDEEEPSFIYLHSKNLTTLLNPGTYDIDQQVEAVTELELNTKCRFRLLPSADNE